MKFPDLASKADILIVGAIPSGLALAAELRRRRIEALTVDEVTEGADTSRAAVVLARAVEVLEPLGGECGRRIQGPGVRVRTSGRSSQLPLSGHSTHGCTYGCPHGMT